ncbi:ABC transporter substrate-binding protein [Rhodococcus qingshengii]|nr:ABC transporter substrate-binding protein [Rhodococcus qingshengii]
MSLLWLSIVVVVVLAGCATREDDYEGAQDSASRSSSFPMTVDNCGRQVTIESPPQRAVSLNQGSTEILLSLGLADRMVGTATWTDPIRENLAPENARVPRLADNKPALESVLDADPDFVSASFSSTFAEGGDSGRDQFEALGIPTYLPPTDNGCDGAVSSAANADGARAEPLRIEMIYNEIRDLAAIFDVRDRGEKFIAELQQRYSAASDTVRAEGVSLAFWFADTKTPYVAGCCGASGMIASALGATNVFADAKDEWPQVSWESVADRNPTALVLGDLSRRSTDGDALDSKISFLETNAATKNLDAVKNKRYIVVNGADMNPSIRTIDGIEKVSAALHGWGLTT